MNVFALADTHLSLAVPGKEMHKFGEQWRDHARRIEANWRSVVGGDDLVLVAGDTSWAMRIAEALPDLEFLDRLPGRKILIPGNHDYWWSSLSKVRSLLPPSLSALDGDAMLVGDVAVCGARLWQAPDISFADIITVGADADPLVAAADSSLEVAQRNERIWRRERERLRRAVEHLQKLENDRPPGAAPLRSRIAMTHFPPCDSRVSPNELTSLFEGAAIDHVVFGHLHSVSTETADPLFGASRGVHYHLVACDFVGFAPQRIVAAAL